MHAPTHEPARAAQLDTLKSATTALLCHDVRGALCIVAGFLDMASEDLADSLDESTLETLVGAHRQMDRILSLLVDLGNYVQMQPPGAAGAAESRLDEILDSLSPAFEYQFGPLGLQIESRIEPSAAACRVHADLVALALRALIGAFGRLDPGPAMITLRGRASAEVLELELTRPTSTPWGDLQERILQGFARGAASAQPHGGGLSLGNWIARHAVELLDGDIRMHCDPEGLLRFVVTLPRPALSARVRDVESAAT